MHLLGHIRTGPIWRLKVCCFVFVVLLFCCFVIFVVFMFGWGDWVVMGGCGRDVVCVLGDGWDCCRGNWDFNNIYTHIRIHTMP